jgi:hypothetical protein
MCIDILISVYTYVYVYVCNCIYVYAYYDLCPMNICILGIWIWMSQENFTLIWGLFQPLDMYKHIDIWKWEHTFTYKLFWCLFRGLVMSFTKERCFGINPCLAIWRWSTHSSYLGPTSGKKTCKIWIRICVCRERDT